MRGGIRKNAGLKTGMKKTLKPDSMRRIARQISIPKWLHDRLQTEKYNVSRYIVALIRADNPDWKPPEE